jgi:hypothetical protein
MFTKKSCKSSINIYINCVICISDLVKIEMIIKINEYQYKYKWINNIMNEEKLIPEIIVKNMDSNNKKAVEIMNKKGMEEAVKFMFQHPTEKNEDGKPREMTYAEMRYYYG